METVKNERVHEDQFADYANSLKVKRGGLVTRRLGMQILRGVLNQSGAAIACSPASASFADFYPSWD